MAKRELRQQLQILLDARLIVEISAGQFAFRHALLQETAYSSLLVRERKGYHLAIGQSLERLHTDALQGYLDDLAHHYYQAGAWEKALEYSRLAGEQAQNRYASGEARDLFTHALEAALRLRLPPPDDLYRGRGQSNEALGDFDGAREDYQQALEAARRTGNRRTEWQSLVDIGFLWSSKDYMQTGDYFRQALEFARSLDDPALLARSLNRMGNWRLNLAQPHEAREYHLEAQAIFERLDDRAGLAETLDLLGLTNAFLGDMSGALADFKRAVALFAEQGNRWGMASSIANMGGLSSLYLTEATAIAGSTLYEGLQWAEQALEIARQIGWPSSEAFASINAASNLRLMGRYAEAMEKARQGQKIAREIGHNQWMVAGCTCMGTIYLDLFALDEAQENLEQALALAVEGNLQLWIRWALGGLTSVFIQGKDLQKASYLIGPSPQLDASTGMGQRLQQVFHLELALAQEDGNLALRVAEWLDAVVFPEGYQENLQKRPAWQCAPRLLWLHGEALSACGRFLEAEARLKTAREGAQALGARPLLWRIQRSLGQFYRKQDRHAEAEAELAGARNLVEELATGVPEGSLRQHFRQSALEMLA